MKIGVLTHWSSDDNYGQQLQCYALQHYLRMQGHDAYLVKYLPQNKQPNTFVPCIKKRVISVLGWFSPQWKEVDKKIKAEKQLLQTNREKNRQRRFEQFRQEHIASTDRVYSSYQQLRDNPPQADAYIVGSDQVWHDSLLFEGAAGWFLNFGSKSTKRIAYAASIGRQITEEEMPNFKAWTSQFDFITGREDSVVEQCKAAGYEKTVRVIDPTLLLNAEAYEGLTGKISKTDVPYLFMYVLNVQSKEETGWPLIEKYITDKGLDARVVYSSGYRPAQDLIPGKTGLLATIPEWLSLIASAESVVTTSFHGAVFSILFHRPFLAVPLGGQLSKANVRLHDLLSTLGLEDRLLDPSAESLKEQMDKPIDWDAVEARISDARQKSAEILLTALS